MLYDEGTPNQEVDTIKGILQTDTQVALEALNVSGIAVFGGFYLDDSNARARTTPQEGGKWAVSFNEVNLELLDQFEAQRLPWHEAQHVLYSLEEQQTDDVWLFVFHPKFSDLHRRMQEHFKKFEIQQYPFKKGIFPKPIEYSDMGDSNSNYTHPDEVLALLRAYQVFIFQNIQSGKSVVSQPYEFIEAFDPEDLRLLESEYRADLAKEVLDKNPEILDTKPKPRDTSAMLSFG